MEARGTAPRSMPSIHQRVYVRSLLLEVSSRWRASNPRLNKSSKVLPAAGRRGRRLAQIFDTAVTAPGGLPQRQGAQPKLRSQSQVVVGFCDFPECFTRDPRTWARHTSCTTHVEPSSPPCAQLRCNLVSQSPASIADPRTSHCIAICISHVHNTLRNDINPVYRGRRPAPRRAPPPL